MLDKIKIMNGLIKCQNCLHYSLQYSPIPQIINLSKTIDARLEYLHGSTGSFDRLQKHNVFVFCFFFKQMVDVKGKKRMQC